MKRVKFTFLNGRGTMNTIFDVAQFFLSRNDPNMTNKKLQKLCYYAHSWSLALRDETLFNERFQAWVHGPVSRELYQEYRGYGWRKLPYQTPPESFNQEELNLLEEVYDTYGDFSGDDLEALSHSEQPWIEARGQCEPYEPSQTFLNDSTIRSYYLDIYEQAQND